MTSEDLEHRQTQLSAHWYHPIGSEQCARGWACGALGAWAGLPRAAALSQPVRAWPCCAAAAAGWRKLLPERGFLKVVGLRSAVSQSFLL
jgi:hypothetical protein